jgi:serine/threonine protein kinase
VVVDYGQLCTFGEAKMDTLTGTPGYTAPEVLHPDKAPLGDALFRPSSLDVFALAATLYYVFVGERNLQS